MMTFCLQSPRCRFACFLIAAGYCKVFAQSLPSHTRIPQCFVAQTQEPFRISFPYPSASHPLPVPLFVAYGCSLATEQHLIEMQRLERVKNDGEENTAGFSPVKIFIAWHQDNISTCFAELSCMHGMHFNRMSFHGCPWSLFKLVHFMHRCMPVLQIYVYIRGG